MDDIFHNVECDTLLYDGCFILKHTTWFRLRDWQARSNSFGRGSCGYYISEYATTCFHFEHSFSAYYITFQVLLSAGNTFAIINKIKLFYINCISSITVHYIITILIINHFLLHFTLTIISKSSEYVLFIFTFILFSFKRNNDLSCTSNIPRWQYRCYTNCNDMLRFIFIFIR